MSPANATLIEEAYITPIKSVLFIDDNFPTHADLLEEKLAGDTDDAAQGEAMLLKGVALHDPASENMFVDGDTKEEPRTSTAGDTADMPRHVRNLIRSCRERGYIFDIENNLTNIERDHYAFINKADLVVLDYYLTQSDDAQHSLKILQNLAISPRYNLVIVHTHENKFDVASEILFSMQGCSKKAINFDRIQNKEEAIAQINSNISHILDNNKAAIDKIFEITQCKNPDIVRKFINNTICDYFTRTHTALENLSIKSNISTTTTPWIATQNAFIVITEKKPADNQTLKDLIDELARAILDFNPGIITTTLQKCINISKENTYNILKESFATTDIRAATLYLAATEYDTLHGHQDRSAILSHKLVGMLLESATSGLAQHASGYCERLLDVTFNAQALNRASNCIQCEGSTCDEKTLHLHANSILCSERTIPHRLTTGSIFEHSGTAWVCVTPACDLANISPDKASSMIHLEAIKLDKINDNIKLADLMKDTARGNGIFITKGSNVTAYSIYIGNKTSICINNFLIQGSALLKEGKITLYKVAFDPKKGEARTVSAEYTVIGQLRPNYASRLLAHKGSWKSRIGVDFINHP
ncbi:hypothetical protein FVW20_00235 [Desulfovibrio oxamicus]|uniref:Response receiver domain-containing protein n=1 Tax=Nitratidesulfovibrio oxamicus TaxID=32016 RepID=A0ABS0IZ71_9BACT|nr:response regulator receiver domain [Nitratidesulfovibrio oxamicus]MBG3875493.1 hypothetical protein [Nitratidesulfovibrio oxamicus]